MTAPFQMAYIECEKNNSVKLADTPIEQELVDVAFKEDYYPLNLSHLNTYSHSNMAESNQITVNIGVMGHVDSGKTSLVRLLSTVASTAAFDKSPQSKNRGITLDLGFSAFVLGTISSTETEITNSHLLSAANTNGEGKVSESLTPLSSSAVFSSVTSEDANFCNDSRHQAVLPENSDLKEDCKALASTDPTDRDTYVPPSVMASHSVLVCLVDCPGHATLIKTVLNGAQIIDMILLVIDITKGFQTQTSECLVIAEIMTDRLIVALNKVDLIPPEQRAKRVERIKEKLRNVFEGTLFGRSVPIIAVSALEGGKWDCLKSTSEPLKFSIGIDELLNCLKNNIKIPNRNGSGALHFAYDHSFVIKGQGTIVTGTILSGSIRVGQRVSIPAIGLTSKVKSMQIFKKSVQMATQGDRVAICLPSVDATKLERGIIVDSNSPLPTLYGCIAVVQRVRFYKGNVRNENRVLCFKRSRL